MSSRTEHVVVTRFSVPRPSSASTADLHRDPRWLDERLELFRSFYVPSVGRLGVRAVLLCSSESLAKVSAAVENLQWARVIEQNRWHGGWTGSSDQVLTRLDSDDTLHEDWFTVVDRAEPRADVVGSRNFLRLHRPKARIYRYRRRTPCPLAAFRGGRNPYAVDHDEIHRYYRMVDAGEPFLLQVAHGGNIASRFPKPFRRRASAGILERFGLEPLGASDPPTR